MGCLNVNISELGLRILPAISRIGDGIKASVQSITEPIEMLLAIEVYASECYDNTQRHLAEVDKLETKEEIESYDYRSGYPNILEF